MPVLKSVSASGASQVRLPDFKSQMPFDANLSGASRLTGALDAPELRLEASGASQGMLTGAIPNLKLTLSGASQFDLSNVTTDLVFAQLSGGSSATVNPSKTLDYHISGASILRYHIPWQSHHR